jgi:hypothetical protein
LIWLKKKSRKTMTTPIYIFNHIPRTAGGAVLSVLAAEFNIVYDYLPKERSRFARWLATPVRLDQVAQGSLVAGHYTATGARLQERYPQSNDASRFRLITFLRRPYSWCASHLRYFGANATRQAVRAHGSETGVFCRTLSALPDNPSEALAGYWYVGLTEYAQTDINRLLGRLGRPPRPLLQTNRSSRTELSTKNEEFVRAYDQRATSDHQLYDTVFAGRQAT